MGKREEVWLIERTPGNAFTTYKDVNGEIVRVPIGHSLIGPFPNIPAAADYLAKNAILHASYEIVDKRSP